MWLALATLAVCLPALQGGFIFDDDVFLTGNPLIAAADGLRRFWFSREAADYWPLTSTTLWVEWRVWGLWAPGYHLTNIALHVGEVLLLWRLLRRLGVPGAFWGALIFAVHPLNAESVAWITQRKNLMGMLFYLLALLGFADGRKIGYGFSVACFAAAMLSKGSTVILPAVLLGLVLWQRRPTTRDALRLLPYAAIALGLALFEASFSTVSAPAPAGAHPLGFVARGLRAIAILWFYLGKTLWPGSLSFDYGHWSVAADDLRWWLPVLALAALLAALWHWRQTHAGREAAFALGYFAIALAPVLGFAEVGFMRYSPVSNHYAHLALTGAAAWAGALLVRSRFSRASQVALAGALAVCASAQVYIYADAGRLYRDTLARNPASSLAATNLGAMLSGEGHLDEAVTVLQQAVQAAPDSAKAHNNLGIALYRLGRIDEAIAQYRDALRYDITLAEAHNNLGAALARSGRLAEAIAEFQAALRLEPGYAGAQQNLDRALRLRR